MPKVIRHCVQSEASSSCINQWRESFLLWDQGRNQKKFWGAWISGRFSIDFGHILHFAFLGF